MGEQQGQRLMQGLHLLWSLTQLSQGSACVQLGCFTLTSAK